jgi:tRNA (guanosine-2'-O-)-methyltransferase
MSNHKQNLLAYLEGFITENRKQRFLDVLANRTNHFTIALEDVYQLHNTSAVMRSCEVFGIQNLHVVEQRYGADIDKQIAMGAEKWVDITKYDNMSSCLTELKKQGYQIIATTPHNDSCMLDEFDVTKKSAIFFGTEIDGLSEEVMQQADGFIKIPMVGFTESLNISVSAALVIQDITNRLRQSDIKWQLNDHEIFEKRLDWTRKTIKDIAFVESRFNEFEN